MSENVINIREEAIKKYYEAKINFDRVFASEAVTIDLINTGIRNGLSVDKLVLFRKPNINMDIRQIMYNGIINDLSNEQIEDISAAVNVDEAKIIMNYHMIKNKSNYQNLRD